jgi:hypothetical protein
VVRERLLRRGVRVRRAQMYKRRLLSFVAFLLELTTSVLALIPEKKEREERKVEKKNEKEREKQQFNMGNID